MKQTPSSISHDFIYMLYELLYGAAIDPMAKQSALEEALWEPYSWPVVAISDEAILAIQKHGKEARVQRGHMFNRKERASLIFDKDKPMMNKEDLVSFFNENDKTTLVTSRENAPRSGRPWSPTRPVPDDLFPNESKFRVRISKLEREWINQQRVPKS